METYYTIYKITNKINGRIYIGCHKTIDLNDGYMGSGKILKRAIDKYGVENFEKEILNVFDNQKDMFEMEATLVCEKFVKSDDTYNICEGGKGGFSYINANPDRYLTEKRLASLMSIDECHKRWKIKYDSDVNFRNKIRDNCAKASKVVSELYPNGTFHGKKHTDDTKLKMSEAKNGMYNGEDNPMYGMMWIHNMELKKSTRIKKSDPIPDGWDIGRKMKF